MYYDLIRIVGLVSGFPEAELVQGIGSPDPSGNYQLLGVVPGVPEIVIIPELPAILGSLEGLRLEVGKMRKALLKDSEIDLFGGSSVPSMASSLDTANYAEESIIAGDHTLYRKMNVIDE